MVRPSTNYEVKKAEILEVALKSFARHGYEGTTNKIISEEGGFKSPALIYHYFPEGKGQLFIECIRNFEPLKTYEKLAAVPHPEPVVYLQRLAEAYLELTKDATVMQVVRIMISETTRFPELIQLMPAKLAPIIIFPLTNYIIQQQMLGKLKAGNPVALTIQFFAPLLMRALIRPLQHNLPIPFPSDEEFVDLLIKNYLLGLSTEKQTE